MAEPSKKRKGIATSSAVTGTRSHGTSKEQTSQIPPSISSPTLFSSEEQCNRYNSLFSSLSIINPKFVDLAFFDDEVYDCFQVFQNSCLIQLISMKLPFYPELVKAFYWNLEIQEDSLIFEVYGIKMVIEQSLFFDLTQLSSDGVPFEGSLDDEWKFDFSVSDARWMVCTNQEDMTGRLLASSLAFECRIMHYLIVRILLLRSSNLAQVSKEDLMIMWVFLTGRQIDWAHLVRYRMHKAMRSNAPLPYPYLITLFI